MLWTALQDPDPVLIFENNTLYNMEGHACRKRRAGGYRHGPGAAGRDATSPSSPTAPACSNASRPPKPLAGEGIEAEVIDLRSLRPLDDATYLASIAKTHRVLIVDEGWRSGSLSAEISARIMEQGFYDLDLPVERLCSAEVPMPYARHMEEAALPQVDSIIATVRRMMSHG